jgi:hypothetical protein
MAEFGRTSEENISGGGQRSLFGFVLVVLLIAAITVEGYYIYALRNTIDAQTEELWSLSVRLQSSKRESTELHKELSSMKKFEGGKRDGNTAEGQY